MPEGGGQHRCHPRVRRDEGGPRVPQQPQVRRERDPRADDHEAGDREDRIDGEPCRVEQGGLAAREAPRERDRAARHHHHRVPHERPAGEPRAPRHQRSRGPADRGGRRHDQPRDRNAADAGAVDQHRGAGEPEDEPDHHARRGRTAAGEPVPQRDPERNEREDQGDGPGRHGALREHDRSVAARDQECPDGEGREPLAPPDPIADRVAPTERDREEQRRRSRTSFPPPRAAGGSRSRPGS